MRIGVLELLYAGSCDRWDQKIFGFLVVKQYASIMPQAVSVWCRNLGHEVFYATYFGQKDPKQLLPNDLDVVFISTYTQASALAYALAKLYRQGKTLTILGGPHAQQYPEDCLRYFDVVVRDCDRQLIGEILRDMPRGQILTSGRMLQEIPSVQERMPEIRLSTFVRGKPYRYTTIPILTSMGCPNACDFCVDWNTPYRLLPVEQLEADMEFLFREFPKMSITFHDPNFAVKSDQVFDVLEKAPGRRHYRYIVESSISMLQRSRLERLKKLGDFFVVTGVESWTHYSHKANIQSTVNSRQKVDTLIEQFKTANSYVKGIQANFLFGLDTDQGTLPMELTKEFALRAPFVVPTFNIPVPFAQTPLFTRYVSENRMLTSMPFAFYYMPYLIYKLKNYNPIDFYSQFIELFSFLSSGSVLLKRLWGNFGNTMVVFNLLRGFRYREMLGTFRTLLHLLKNDKPFRDFHEGETPILPEYYHSQYEKILGAYAALMTREERKPILGSSEISSTRVLKSA